MRSVLCLLTLVAPSLGRVNFLGWGPDNGNVVVTCGVTTSYPVGRFFAQSPCIPGPCQSVMLSMMPDLSLYGFTLPAGGTDMLINPTSQALSLPSLQTTVTANDGDVNPPNATLTFTFNCPLRFIGSNIPPQTATEGTWFSLNVSGYFSNPTRNQLAWNIEGLPAQTMLTISPQGILTGTPSYAEARLVQPLRLAVVATDSRTATVARSNQFELLISQKPGLTFPSSLGQIPPQTAAENVLFQLQAAKYFNNPSNLAVVWQVTGGSLRIDSAGVISDTPGSAELRTQPIIVTVTGTDERGNVAISNPFNFIVTPQRLVTNSVPNPLPSVMCGALCCSFNISDFVFNPSSNPIQVTNVFGLPAASTIRANPDGSLSGVTSIVDVRASPITITGNVNNGATTPIPLNPMTFSVTQIPAPQLSGLVFLNQTVKVGSFYQLDTSPYFVVPTGGQQQPTWTISTPSTSLSVDFSGKVSGTITEQDFSLGSTLSFTVTVSNRNLCGGGSASMTFSTTLDPNWSGPNCNVLGMPVNFAVCQNSFVSRNLSQYCQDPKGLALTYTMTGLPNASGLVLSPNGFLSGSVSAAAAAAGTAGVTLCAMNIRNLRDCTQQFSVNFQRPKSPPIVDPPIPSPVTAIKGQRFVGYFNFHFYEPDWQPLIYSVAGLPLGSGLGIGPITGIFSGTPNEADFRASPLVLSIFASNEQNVVSGNVCVGQSRGGRARADLIIVVENPPSVPICRAIPPPAMPAQTGQFWALDVSRSFSAGADTTKLEYALRSLPRGSGLGIDPRSGVISGVLTASDAAASPVTLVVAVTNGYGMCQSNVVLVVGNRPPVPFPGQNPGGPLIPVGPFIPGQCVNPRDIFIQTVNEGQNLNLDLSRFFIPAQIGVRLSFQVTGFPPGSGFSVDPYSGILSGVPSPSDLSQGSLMLQISVSCGNGPPITKQMQLTVSRGGCNACSFNNGGCQQQCTVQNPSVCSPTCGCNYGFVLNADGRTCRSGGACAQGNGGCGSVCSGDGSCSCGPNWSLMSDTRTCQYDPCTYNNGGCEQLCTASGQQPRCDCRVGSLNPDGRSCSSSIITVGTIPPALVIGCQNFAFDFSTAFRSAGGQRLSFTMNGLPPGTGFTMSPSGMMQGTPTNADCALPQPITVGVTASYAGSSVYAVMFMSAFCQNPSACPTNPTPAITSPSASIPLLSAMVCVPFRFDVSPYFTGGDGLIQFSCLGLTAGSGFQMSPQGVLSGVPNDRDCAMSPLSVTIVARDSRGRESKSLVTIRFTSCGCVQGQGQGQGQWTQPSYPSQPAYPSYPAYQPQPSTITLPASSITIPASQINIPASQITIPGSQVFIPGSQVTIPGSQVTVNPGGNPIITSGSGSSWPANPINPINPINPNTGDDSNLHIHNTAQCGQPFFVDTAEYFRVNGLRFGVSGLPINSGLRLSDTGILSGTPNLADARAVNPLMVQVTATDRMGVSVSLTVEIEIQGDCGGLAPLIPSLQYRSSYAVPPFDENTGILPVQSARKNEYFRLDLARISFTSLTGNLRYVVTGLPDRSGLSLSKAGLLSGIPNDVDCAQPQPYQLTIQAVSGDVATARNSGSGLLCIQVLCTNATYSPIIPLTTNLPTASAVVGDLLYYDASVYLLTSNTLSVVSFQCNGIAVDSNLRMSSMGVLSGVVSAADMNGPPLLISVTDQMGNTAQSTLRLNVRARVDNNSAPIFVPLDVANAPVGRPFSLNIGQRFYDKDGDSLVFSMSDLVTGSGLKFDPKTGVLSGTPTASDAQQTQPVRLVFFAEDGKGAKTEGPIFMTFPTSARAQTSKAAIPQISTGLNRDPVAIAIKRQTATENVPFLMGVASAFVDQDGDLLSYKLDGLPFGTGLSIDASGLISGTPTQADADALQPLTLAVTASDGQGGSCSQEFLLTVLHGQKTANHDPVAQTIPDAQLYVAEPFILRLTFSFADPDGDEIAYSLAGAPPNTGLFLDSSSGVLSGTPSSADQAASPLTLTIVVDDGMGGIAKSFLKVSVVSRKQKANRPPQSRAMPSMKIDGNSTVNFAVTQYFSDPDSDRLSYQAYGLPKGSGLSLSQAGVLSGKPSKSDLIARQPLAVGIVACDGKGGCAGSVFYLTLKSSEQTSQSVVLLPDFVKNTRVSSTGIPLVEFEIGSWGFFQTSRYFPAGQGLVYAIGGLTNQTGLAFNASSGVLSGVPTLRDVIAADSCSSRCLGVVVTATGETGNVVSQPLELAFSSAGDDVNHAPFARSIPQSVFEPGKMFLLDVWPSFVDSDGDQLSFSVLGLPANSGFSIVESSGVFFGFPTSADLSAPILVTVVVNDQKGGKAQEILQLSPKTITKKEKTCQQLGWVVLPGSSFCSSSNFSGECAKTMSFEQAENTCTSVGAHLCSSQQLSEARLLQEDPGCGMNVWSASPCAFDGEMLTQIAGLTSPKECQLKSAKASLRCCAESGVTSKAAAAVAVSRKSCDQLPSAFVTAPSSPNKAICMTAAVSAKGGCSDNVNFAKATELCAKRMARLCTSDELSQDVGNDQTCGYSNKRMWTSTSECAEGEVITQAGASSFLHTIPKQCTKTTAALPVYCCADQKPNQYFQHLDVSSTKTSISFSWDWKVYPRGSISYRPANAEKSTNSWITPVHGDNVPMGGLAKFQLSALQPNVRYLVRITPMTADKQIVKTQAVEFRVTTLE